MKRFTLALVLLFLVAAPVMADESSTNMENDSYFEMSDAADSAEDGRRVRRFELAMQVLSRDSEVIPMIGPSFGYSLNPRWELGFRGMFSTKQSSTVGMASTGTYSGLAFARYAFDGDEAHFYLEPGVGFLSNGGSTDLAAEAQVGFEAWVSRSISIGASTGVDFGINRSAMPKLMAATAYRF